MTRTDRIAALKAASRERILVLDGSWGVMIQKRGLEEADFRGDHFAGHPGQLKGNNDLLCLTRPDIITELHDAYFGAGADISETNTFSATTIAQADYGLEAAVRVAAGGAVAPADAVGGLVLGGGGRLDGRGRGRGGRGLGHGVRSGSGHGQWGVQACQEREGGGEAAPRKGRGEPAEGAPPDRLVSERLSGDKDLRV